MFVLLDLLIILVHVKTVYAMLLNVFYDQARKHTSELSVKFRIIWECRPGMCYNASFFCVGAC